MKIIVGLGNPGSRYEHTRHNVGFQVVNQLASKWAIDMGREKFHAWFGDGTFGEERVVLMKPTTFMNRSGQSVAAAVKFYAPTADDLLVISDDIALPCGRIRLRRGGSSGGQNGLQDVINRLGTDGFPRMRLGIDPPAGDASGYVLQPFSKDQQIVIDRAVDRAVEAVACWIQQGIDEAMNRFNRDEEV